MAVNSIDPTRLSGAPAGTYYFQFLNIGTGALTGIFHVTWEERD